MRSETPETLRLTRYLRGPCASRSIPLARGPFEVTSQTPDFSNPTSHFATEMERPSFHRSAHERWTDGTTGGLTESPVRRRIVPNIQRRENA